MLECIEEHIQSDKRGISLNHYLYYNYGSVYAAIKFTWHSKSLTLAFFGTAKRTVDIYIYIYIYCVAST